VRVHSLTLSYTPGSMWCDSRASSWPATLQPFWISYKPKARVATLALIELLSNSSSNSNVTNLDVNPIDNVTNPDVNANDNDDKQI
jgi:hypothetical protein